MVVFWESVCRIDADLCAVELDVSWVYLVLRMACLGNV